MYGQDKFISSKDFYSLTTTFVFGRKTNTAAIFRILKCYKTSRNIHEIG